MASKETGQVKKEAEGPRALAGTCVFILNDEDKFIIGQRKGSHGSGTWALPGGHIEFDDTIFSCAEREVKEETGLEVKANRLIAMTHDKFKDTEPNKHYITLWVAAKIVGDVKEPQVLEKEKCFGWKWVSWKELQEWSQDADKELFLPFVNLLKVTGSFEDLLKQKVIVNSDELE